jgi:glycosyltransferase involved in cell wall biosynthesis
LHTGKKTVVVLKGYPRLSETFIAQELLGLEKAGLPLAIFALRRPTDGARHKVHDEIRAPVRYLPEYLHQEPVRVLRGLWKSLRQPGFGHAIRTFLADLRRDFTRNRWRRFGQAMVLAGELPADTGWLHAHFIHTPASVTAYASLICRIPWSCSAHAKDIWTSPAWDLSAKLGQANWAVTCTRAGFEKLQQLAPRRSKVHLSYHGLDLERFGRFEGRLQQRDGRDPGDPVIIASVGRAVPKKGYDILLRALALIDPALSFRFIHVGGGEELARLKALAGSLDLGHRIEWQGARTQEDVLALYRQADIFALACRVTEDGDRDGLPNVIVEACSQGLVCVSTTISGVPELLTHERNGLLVNPEDPEEMARQLSRLIIDPALRRTLGDAAETRVRAHFDHRVGISQLTSLFETGWRETQ